MIKRAFAIAPMVMRAGTMAAKSMFKSKAKGLAAGAGGAALNKVKNIGAAPSLSQAPGAAAPSNPSPNTFR